MATTPYALDEKTGKLTRDGEHIGDLVGEEIKLLEGFGNYKASVTRWVNKQDDEAEAPERRSQHLQRTSARQNKGRRTTPITSKRLKTQRRRK